MRSQFGTKEYFQAYLRTKLVLIENTKTLLTSFTPGDIGIIHAQYIVFEHKLEALIARYSMGEDINIISNMYDSVHEEMRLTWKITNVRAHIGKGGSAVAKYYLNPYCHFLWMISLMILLGKEQVYLKSFQSIRLVSH